MAKFDFKKSDMLPILAKHKFDDIDETAYVKILTTIEILVFNLLNNVLYVIKSLNVKTITKKHCLAVLQIMKDYENGKKVIVGGSLVMPSEYYGQDSGRYFDADVVSALENQPWADPSLTRTALDASLSGGRSGRISSFISKEQVKNIIEKYKESEKANFKIASNVYDIIISCIMSNLDSLFDACRKNGKDSKKITIRLLYNTLKKNPKQFAHMSYILK